MKKTIQILFPILIMAIILNGCSILTQKKFSYLNKVPANTVSAEYDKNYPPPAENNFTSNTQDHELTENQERDIKSESKISDNDRKKENQNQIRNVVKNLLFPDFGRMKAKISDMDNSDNEGSTITLIALAILIILILYHVITKTNLGCWSTVLLIFCIVFIIAGLVI